MLPQGGTDPENLFSLITDKEHEAVRIRDALWGVKLLPIEEKNGVEYIDLAKHPALAAFSVKAAGDSPCIPFVICEEYKRLFAYLTYLKRPYRSVVWTGQPGMGRCAKQVAFRH